MRAQPRHLDVSQCLLPDCSRRVHWRDDGAGKQPLFCSTQHARTFRNHRSRLLDTLRRVEAELASAPSAKARLQLLKSQQQLRWKLISYRPLDIESKPASE